MLAYTCIYRVFWVYVRINVRVRVWVRFRVGITALTAIFLFLCNVTAASAFLKLKQNQSKIVELIQFKYGSLYEWHHLDFEVNERNKYHATAWKFIPDSVSLGLAYLSHWLHCASMTTVMNKLIPVQVYIVLCPVCPYLVQCRLGYLGRCIANDAAFQMNSYIAIG